MSIEKGKVGQSIGERIVERALSPDGDLYIDHPGSANARKLIAEIDRAHDDMKAALEWYAQGGGVASIEEVARGDVDLARASEALTEDCGDRARAALRATGSQP